MSEPVDNAAEIKETDIVFDCPHCGKSLAIDHRGAGLSIPCTDCGKDCEVPIPEGMELLDIDSSEADQEIRIINLRRALTAAEERIKLLESRLDRLAKQRALGEGVTQGNKEGLKILREQFKTIQSAQLQISNSLEEIVEALA